MFVRRTGSTTPNAFRRYGLGSSSYSIIAHKRMITSRGQFNPIHDFSPAMNKNIKATNEKEFENMIKNPGPLRVGFSTDYLDWLYKAYKSKLKNKEVREKVEKVFHGRVLSETSDSSTGLIGTTMQFMRPTHSIRRKAAERLRMEAQETIDQAMLQQGMLDLFERQSQFPVIHVNRADRFHIVELFKEIVLDKALEPHEIWDKALLYRAILSERRESYPSSFAYIFEAVDNTSLAPIDDEESVAKNGSIRKLPKETEYLYFEYLVKKYYLENAVEAHVALRCHRDPNSSHLLFSVPPPKDDKEIRGEIEKAHKEIFTALKNQGPSSTGGANKGTESVFSPPAPASYPPIQALWKCEENFPLLLLLVFGELNLIVTENPFSKFPNAQPFLTRPYSTADDTDDSTSSADPRNRSAVTDAVSLASAVAQRRGPLMAPLPRNLSSAIDARGKDLRRLRQRFHREDILGHQKFLQMADQEGKQGNYSSFADWAYFNPRAVRAELRDEVQQSALKGLKEYERARKDIYRMGYDEVEQQRTDRPVESMNAIPSYVPSLPHFLSIVQRDSHISFLMNVVLDTQKQKRLDQLCYQLANALYRTSLDYHNEEVRRVNRQKVQVAAVLLDNLVKDEWNYLLTRDDVVSEQLTGDLDGSSRGLARMLGDYAPFENRALDESGFTTDARMDDYDRWMAKPVADYTTA